MSPKHITLALLIAALALPAYAQTPTPVPTLVIPTVPVEEINNNVGQAAEGVNNLPSDISKPSGQSVIPSGDATMLFGYAKWLFSINTAQELMGKTLAPLGMNVFIVLTVIMLLLAVYLAVMALTLIIRFVVWILGIIIRAIELIPGF